MFYERPIKTKSIIQFYLHINFNDFTGLNFFSHKYSRIINLFLRQLSGLKS